MSALIAIIGLFLFLRIPTLSEPYWYGDEGIYLVLGQAIRKGLTLYTQIHDNKPPSLYYLAALSQTVYGFRLLLLIWMVPTIYFFYLLSQKFFNKKLSTIITVIFLILTSIPLFEGTIANAEIFMLLPTIFAVLLVLSKPTDLKYLSISGLLLGFAFTIKVPVFIEVAFLTVWIFFENCRFDFKKIKFTNLAKDITVFLAAFTLPIILYSLFFITKKAFPEFMFAALLQNFGYLSSWATGSHTTSATSGGLIGRGLIMLVCWISFYFLFIKKIITREIFFLSLWLSSAMFGALLSGRPYPHYLIQTLPPFCLLFAYLLLPEHKHSRKVSLLFLVSLIFVFIKFKFYVYPVVSYYQNYYSYLFTLKDKSSYQKFFNQNIDNTYAIAKYVNGITDSSDRIFVWGDEPFIYALSDRLPVGKYTVAYHIVDFNQYQNIYGQLIINFPKVIVYYPQPNRPYPDLDNFITKYYLPIKTFGSAIIYQSLK